MTEKISEKKSRYCIFLNSGIILPSAYLFAVASDMPYIFLLVCFGLFLSFLKSKPFAYSDRSIIYGLLLAIATAVMGDLVLKIDSHRMGIISGIFQANISTPFLLYAAVIVTFFKSSPYTLGACACLSLAATILGGEMLSINFENENMVLFYSWIQRHSYKFFAIIISTEMLFLLLSLNSARKAVSKSSSPFKLQKRLIIAFSLLAMPALALFFHHTYNKYERSLKNVELYLLRMGMKRRGPAWKTIFNNEVDLNRTIDKDIESNFQKIVLRATGPMPPGYLRGRAYANYSNGKWKAPEDDKIKNFKKQQQTGIIAYNTFAYPEKTEEAMTAKFEIYPASSFSSGVILTPGNAKKFDIVADKLKYSRDGVITPEEWIQDGGYSCYATEKDQASAYPSPETPLFKQYLQTPPALSKEIENALYGVLKPELWEKKPPDSEVIKKLTSWFLNNFEYSLEAKPEEGEDPIETFIKKKKGHCELFATTMTMMLRKHGIPARYITGFICEETHPSNKYYVARLGNAHAWLEAYARDMKKWILVEPTPPSGMPNFEHKWGVVESWIDRFKQIFQETFANMRRGHFAQAIIDFATGVYSYAKDFLWHPLRGPLTIIPLLLLAFYIRRRKRIARRKSLQLPTSLLELMNDFARFETIIAKKTGIKRPKTMTIDEWAAKLPENFSEFLKKYQDLRYRKTAPDIKQIKLLKKDFVAALKKL
jgi:hypothetical protein